MRVGITDAMVGGCTTKLFVALSNGIANGDGALVNNVGIIGIVAIGVVVVENVVDAVVVALLVVDDDD